MIDKIDVIIGDYALDQRFVDNISTGPCNLIINAEDLGGIYGRLVVSDAEDTVPLSQQSLREIAA